MEAGFRNQGSVRSTQLNPTGKAVGHHGWAGPQVSGVQNSQARPGAAAGEWTEGNVR